MFCNNCGKKIKAGSSRCSCGAPVEQMEYCGGFWGLVGKKPEKPRRNDIGESQNSQIPVERAALTSGHTASGNSEPSFENDERRSRGSGAGIGLIIGGIMAAIVLIGSGAFLLMRKENPKPPVRTAKEGETKVSEATEIPENNTGVSEKQLEYQYKYLKYRFDELEDKERDLEDPNSDEVINSSAEQTKNERYWEDFEKFLGAEGTEDSLSQEFEQFRADYSSYGKEVPGFTRQDFDEMVKKLRLAQLDLKVHKELPDIQKTEDGSYEWGNGRETQNVEMAKKIIKQYEELQPDTEGKTTEPQESCLNSNTFASGLTLIRMEALLYDYCINYYKDKLGVGEEESLNKSVTSEDYEAAKKKAGNDQDFEGDYDNLWYAGWCINDLQNNGGKDGEAAINNLNNDKSDAETIENLRDSNPDKDKGKDSTSMENSTSDSTSMENSTSDSTLDPSSANEPTQGPTPKNDSDRKNNDMNNSAPDYDDPPLPGLDDNNKHDHRP